MVYEVLNRHGQSIRKGTKESVTLFLENADDLDGLTVIPDHGYDNELSAKDFLNDMFWEGLLDKE